MDHIMRLCVFIFKVDSDKKYFSSFSIGEKKTFNHPQSVLSIALQEQSYRKNRIAAGTTMVMPSKGTENTVQMFGHSNHSKDH